MNQLVRLACYRDGHNIHIKNKSHTPRLAFHSSWTINNNNNQCQSHNYNRNHKNQHAIFNQYAIFSKHC